MRPIRLELSGFTCFRDHTSIDFSDLELFAIVGQTGAGKSSILDAITFALFEKTPRLGNKPAKELMSQGSLGMSLSFEFQASDGRTYRVARTHAQKNFEPRFEPKDGEKWATVSEKTKKADIALAIEQVVGLSFEAFTKAVLLPQGEFDRFLRGKPDERRGLLKDLIGLERIEAMQKRAGETARDAKTRAQAIQVQLDSLQNATPEALEALEQQQQQQQSQLEQSRLALEEARIFLSQAQEIEKLEQALRQTEQELGRLEAQTPKIVQHQQQVEEARRVAAVLPLLETQRRQAVRQTQLERELEQKNTERQRTQTRQHQAEQTLESARDEALLTPRLTAKIETLTALQPRLERLQQLGGSLGRAKAGQVFSEAAWTQLERLEADLPQFERLGKQIGELERRREELVQSAKNLESAQTALHQHQAGLHEAQVAVQHTQSALNEAQTASAQIPQLEAELRQLEALRPQLTRLEQLGGSLQAADPTAPAFSEAIWARLEVVASEQKSHAKLLKNLQTAKTELEAARDAVVFASSQHQDSQNALETVKELGQVAKANLEHLERLLETAKRENAVAALLQNTQPGDPCPICGQPLRELPKLESDVPELEAKVQNAKLELEQKREQFSTLRETVLSHKAAKTAANNELTRAEQALVNLKLERGQLEESWRDVLSDLSDPKTALQQARTQQLAGLAQTLVNTGAADADTRRPILEAQKRNLQHAEQRAASQHSQAQAALARAESALQAAQDLLETRQNEHKTAQQKAMRLEQERLELNAERQGLQQKLEARLGKPEGAVGKTAQASSAEYSLALKNAKSALLAGFAAELLELGATANLTADIEALKQQRQNLELAQQHAKEALANAKTSTAAALAAFDSVQVQRNHAHSELEQTNTDVAMALGTLGLYSAEEAHAKALSESQIQQLEAEISQHTQHKNLVQQKHQETREALGGRKTAQPSTHWAEQVKTLEQDSQTLRGLLGRLEAEHQQLKNQIQTSKTLRRQQNTLEKQFDTYQTLSLDLRGNEFQDYLLEGVQKQLLYNASRTMQTISKQRYSLELIDSEFQVRDAWNGLEARGVKTLSGGESFIASLCLALSLSDYLAGNQALGALFLDEGFGTLDADALEMVASALEELNTIGRMVGVITHVPMLANRLPVRLQIEKLQDSSRVKWDRD